MLPSERTEATTSWAGKPDFDSRLGPPTLSREQLESRGSRSCIKAAGYDDLVDSLTASDGKALDSAQATSDALDAVRLALAGRNLPQVEALLGVFKGRVPNPAHLLQTALTSRDRSKVGALVALGAATDLQLIDIEVSCQGELLELERVTAMAAAVLLDSEAGRLEFLPLLAAAGSLEQIDSQGRNLLHFAFDKAVVRFLMDAGLSLDSPDSDGVCARDLVPPGILAELEQGALNGVLPPGKGPRDSVPRL